MGDAIVLPKNWQGETAASLFFSTSSTQSSPFHGAAIAQLNPKTLAIEKQIDVSGFPSMEIHWGTAMIVDGASLYIYGQGSTRREEASVRRSHEV
jgi:hypothetical protein